MSRIWASLLFRFELGSSVEPLRELGFTHWLVERGTLLVSRPSAASGRELKRTLPSGRSDSNATRRVMLASFQVPGSSRRLVHSRILPRGSGTTTPPRSTSLTGTKAHPSHVPRGLRHGGRHLRGEFRPSAPHRSARPPPDPARRKRAVRGRTSRRRTREPRPLTQAPPEQQPWVANPRRQPTSDGDEAVELLRRCDPHAGSSERLAPMECTVLAASTPLNPTSQMSTAKRWKSPSGRQPIWR